MADINDLLLQAGYYAGGGEPKRNINRLNEIFGTISSSATDWQKQKMLEQEMEKKRLEAEKLRLEQMPLERAVGAPASPRESLNIILKRPEPQPLTPEQDTRMIALKNILGTYGKNEDWSKGQDAENVLTELNTLLGKKSLAEAGRLSEEEKSNLLRQGAERKEKLGELEPVSKLSVGNIKEILQAKMAAENIYWVNPSDRTKVSMVPVPGYVPVKASALPKESKMPQETWFVKQAKDGVQYLRPDLTISDSPPPPGATIRQLYPTPEEKGEAAIENKKVEMTGKLVTAVRRLDILNKQFSKAFPSGDRTPLEQRIAGAGTAFGAKYGLIDNPAAVALGKNVRPIAINLIRLFGEVGNLSESEQQGALDTVRQEGLTDKERIAQTKQFVEFALAGADPEVLRRVMKTTNIQGILDAFGVDLSEFATEGVVPEESKNSIKSPPLKTKAIMGKTSTGIGYMIRQNTGNK